MFKCKEIVETFHAHDAAIEVATAEELRVQVTRLLKDPLLCEAYQKKAKDVMEAQAKVMETVLHNLLPYLRNLAEYDRQRTSLLV